ncbi:MAG: tripartite tricarboxylate transporter permease [Nocardioidaceae bacterium]
MSLDYLADGIAAVVQPDSLLVILVGVLVGTVTGVLPGLGAVGAMAVLMPFSIALDPAQGILLLAGVYLGAQYGGSTTSVLMRVPGEASSVVTAIDGYEMTKRGRGGAALAIAALASFVAGTLSVLALMLIGPQLADIAVRFSAPEFLVLGVVALLVLSRVSGERFALAMVSVGIGLGLAAIGLDPESGQTRLTFGISDANVGIEITSVAVGLFGLAEVFLVLERRRASTPPPGIPMRELLPTRTELGRSTAPMFRGGLIGFLTGLIPGPSAVLATYASYSLERKVSRHRGEFGRGAVEGVAGPEAANNGATGAAMIPLLVLGIPFAAPTAILLGALTLNDVTPGPLLIADEPVLFWTIIAGLYAANVMLLVLNLPLVGLFTLLLRVPRDILLTAILVVTLVGTYAVRNSIFDVAVLVVMGALGYVMVKCGLPRAPLILGFVLGGLIETSLVQTVALADGDVSYLLGRPIAMGILALGLVALVAPALVRSGRTTEEKVDDS